MKTLMTIFLVLALVAPGAALAGPNEGVTVSLWQSVVEWISDALDGVRDYGGAVDPAGATSQEPEGLPSMGGNVDPAGLTVEGGDASEASQPQVPEDPPILEMGGNVDPVG